MVPIDVNNPYPALYKGWPSSTTEGKVIIEIILDRVAPSAPPRVPCVLEGQGTHGKAHTSRMRSHTLQLQTLELRVYLTHSWKFCKPTPVGKSWWQEWEATGHTVSAVKKQEGMNACS